MEIKVNSGKRETKIIKEKDGILFVDVKGKAEDNEANNEIIRFFSKKFNKNVKIIRGFKSKKKIIKFF